MTDDELKIGLIEVFAKTTHVECPPSDSIYAEYENAFLSNISNALRNAIEEGDWSFSVSVGRTAIHNGHITYEQMKEHVIVYRPRLEKKLTQSGIPFFRDGNGVRFVVNTLRTWLQADKLGLVL